MFSIDAIPPFLFGMIAAGAIGLIFYSFNQEKKESHSLIFGKYHLIEYDETNYSPYIVWPYDGLMNSSCNGFSCSTLDDAHKLMGKLDEQKILEGLDSYKVCTR